MRVLNHLHSPFFSHLSRGYPAQSQAFTGFYGAYNSYPPSIIIRNPNQIFSNPLTQFNPIPPSINYSVPNLSYPGRHNSISSISYSSSLTNATYSNPPYVTSNPPIFYAPQSSNLPHNFGSSNSSNYNLSSYRSNQFAVDSNPPIQFTDSFSMPIRKTDGSYDKLDLKQISRLVPIGFTGGILEPEIDSSNNKLKICNSVSLSEVQSKIWIRNGDNLVELPNHLLEKNPQISEQNLHSSPMIAPQTITSETSFLGQHIVSFPTIVSAINKLSVSLDVVKRITNLEEKILTDAKLTHENCKDDSLTANGINSLPSISGSTPLSSPLSSPSSPSPSPPSTTINRKLEIMTLEEKMVNGGLGEYEFRSKFIVRFDGNPEKCVAYLL